MIFVWLRSVALAIGKVKARSQSGCHSVAEEIDKRRRPGYPIAIWKDGKAVVGKVEEVIPDYRSKYKKLESDK